MKPSGPYSYRHDNTRRIAGKVDIDAIAANVTAEVKPALDNLLGELAKKSGLSTEDLGMYGNLAEQAVAALVNRSVIDKILIAPRKDIDVDAYLTATVSARMKIVEMLENMGAEGAVPQRFLNTIGRAVDRHVEPFVPERSRT